MFLIFKLNRLFHPIILISIFQLLSVESTSLSEGRDRYFGPTLGNSGQWYIGQERDRSLAWALVRAGCL